MSGAVPTVTGPKLSALVVDDEQDICEFLSFFLEGEGFEVTTMSDPTLVVERIRDEVFHIIVIDEIMPKLCGHDLLAQIRTIDDDVAVIMTTVSPSLAGVTAAIPYGISAYIVYPPWIEGLRDVFARVVRRNVLRRRREEVLRRRRANVLRRRRDDDAHVAIGRRIYALREARGLTLDAAARRAKLSASVLSQIERGEVSALVSSLFRIAMALRVSVTDLLDGY